MLSDDIAERVVRVRKDAGLTRGELAQRCMRLGAQTLTEAALANIENGRRDETGKRHRRINADELAVLAIALDVPLVWLQVDVKAGKSVAIAEGVEVDAWAAALWMIGKQQLEPDKPSSGEWAEAHELLDYACQVASLVEQYRSMLQYRERHELMLPGSEPDAEEREHRERQDRSILGKLVSPLGNLVKREVPLPVLPDEIVARCAELGVELPGQKR